MSCRQRTRRTAPLAVDPLEGRQLLSLMSVPATLSGASVARGKGAFTVLFLSDDANSQTLLRSPQAHLTLTITSGSVTRTLTKALYEGIPDINRDGIPDLVARFRYRDIQGLPPGSATATISDGVTSETGTLTISAPPVHRLRRGR